MGLAIETQVDLARHVLRSDIDFKNFAKAVVGPADPNIDLDAAMAFITPSGEPLGSWLLTQFKRMHGEEDWRRALEKINETA